MHLHLFVVLFLAAFSLAEKYLDDIREGDARYEDDSEDGEAQDDRKVQEINWFNDPQEYDDRYVEHARRVLHEIPPGTDAFKIYLVCFDTEVR